MLVHSSNVFEMSVCRLTSLARSRDALAALTLRSSTLISQALDLVFSHSSLYLIYREVFSWRRGVWRIIQVRLHIRVNLHRCTRLRWPWRSWFGAGPWTACTDVCSFHSQLCSWAETDRMWSQSLEESAWSWLVAALPCWPAEHFSLPEQSQGCLSPGCTSLGQYAACNSSTIVKNNNNN